MLKVKVTNPKSFIETWKMAERSSGGKSTLTAVGGIKFETTEKGLKIFSTDLKISLTSLIPDVEILEPGSAVLPVNFVGELLKKIKANEFEIAVDNNKGVIKTQRSYYRFVTYPVSEFPDFPSFEDAEKVCIVSSKNLISLIDEGTFAGSVTEEFPPYLSSGYIEVKDGMITTVATDGKRLSLKKLEVTDFIKEDNTLLPIKGLLELRKIVASLKSDVDIEVRFSPSQAFFIFDDVVVGIRSVDSTFPDYTRVIPQGGTTFSECSVLDLRSAVECADIVAKQHGRVVVFRLSPGGSFVVEAKAEGIGEVKEELDAIIDGEPLVVGFNAGYILDLLKVIGSEKVKMTFNGSKGQMLAEIPGTNDFMYILMPVALDEGYSTEGEVSES